MNGIMLWAGMLWSSHSLEDERNYVLGMDALVTHACSRHRNGDSSSISSRSQGVYVLEILRGSAKVASRVKALFVHFPETQNC